MIGGEGNDTVQLRVDAIGFDTVVDFNVADDFLALEPGVTFDMLTLTATADGHSTFVRLGDQTLAVLLCVLPEQLTEDNFVEAEDESTPEDCDCECPDAIAEPTGLPDPGAFSLAGVPLGLFLGDDSADFLEATTGGDIVRGGRGNDTLEGEAGNDTIFGGGLQPGARRSQLRSRPDLGQRWRRHFSGKRRQ